MEAHDVSEEQLAQIARASRVPDAATACHTAQIGGYVVEGHVPVEAIRRMLREKPAIVGLAVPGMPPGSPGMAPPGAEGHYGVLAIGRDGRTTVYERR